MRWARTRGGVVLLVAMALASNLFTASRASASAPAAGYWLAGADGGAFAFGNAIFAGSAGATHLAAPIVGIAATPTGRGYWLVAADGGVFAFGDAVFAGSAAGIHLAAPTVGIAATPTGRGYWLVAADGGVFAFGDATWYGSSTPLPGKPPLPRPVVGIAAAPSGLGYWLVTADGHVNPFGEAGGFGDASNVHLGGPVVGLAPTPSGAGYWLVSADGGVLTYGDAPFRGSLARRPLAAPPVAITASPTGQGYWIVTSDGGVFSFGDAPYLGALAEQPRVAPVVGIATVPFHHGVEVATFFYPWYATPAQDGAWRHWDEGSHTPPDDIGSDYYPLRAAYSSDDPAILDSQLAEIADAGIDKIVSSWWGQGSFEDYALGPVMAAASAHGVRVAVHLEPYPGRSIQTVASDIAYLHKRGIDDFWMYEALDLPGDGLRSIIDANPGARFLAETGDIDAVRAGAFAAWAANAHFDAIYSYDGLRYDGEDYVLVCATARAHGIGCAPAVSPGFTSIRATGSTATLSRANGATYDEHWMGAIGAHPDIVAITTYNEWHEGTQIEPAVPKCLPGGFCYLNYDGAYGLSGTAATHAYIGRTKLWTARYRAASP